jgi:hypothetical protein
MTETSFSKTVKDALQLYQNRKLVVWHDRLQAGKVQLKSGRWMHLCRAGTPDRYAILSDGTMLWIEVKTMAKSSKIEGPQIEFKRMIDAMPGDKHIHMTVRRIEPFYEFFEEYEKKLKERFRRQ